jgi:four helix bundle protein
MNAFRRLSVWRKAHELTVRIYGEVESIRQRYPSLAQQMARAAHSIPSNIAEGSGRATPKQFAQFLQIAIGSARELDYFLQLAVDLGAISTSDHAGLEARTDEVIRMLLGLRRTITRSTTQDVTQPRSRAAKRL